ncbi:M6 family metalloprotease domain-containing protein [Pseudobacteroides cellulosolvens]|uniref:M6 family metalloprotease domain protein n=1 Tax=Pseudobacteroides cellulosolvens ATCC 35603 = DSM 2933 TaxID=398512 RepID=A0A0L6JWS8_9FIRM|nr:M6 family metalloprotease domain-containing protein [Pseudobacteroides cellulosolvens]KNY30306.1 M6 family metalloprotease domain protein [Pseudobacteroides cellulosolvens ATCC 35603 = DSM 2933]
MFKHARKTVFSAALISGAILLGSSTASAAPYSGDLFNLIQPDGSFVSVKVFGDEFYQKVESIDGYTLIRDPKTNWICYADLNSEGTEFVSTGVVYKNSEKVTPPAKLDLEKGLDISEESVIDKVNEAKKEVNWDKLLDDSSEAAKESTKNGVNVVKGASSSVMRSMAPAGETIRNVTGLTLLIDFSDQKSDFTQQQISDMLNRVGYKDYGNNGSVHDYYTFFSDGKMNYTNSVTAFYTAKNPKTYYDDKDAGKAGELIVEALDSLKAKGFDFTKLTVDPEGTDTAGTVTAFNVLYAGNPSWGWSKGLWPHAGGIPQYQVGGVKLSRYQITNIGDDLNIGTIVHENGHMLCGWPDTYDYGGESSGTGGFDLMSSGNGKNPQPPNPYFRSIRSGWGTPIELDLLADGSIVDVPQNSLNPYVVKNADTKEYFMIESIKQEGYRTNMPGEGLLIWHIDEKGNNSLENMTPSKHYMVSVEQADGKYDLENKRGSDANDFFKAGNNASFGLNTIPDSRWWNGNYNQTISLTNINAAGTQFTYNRALSPDITEGGTASSNNAFDNNTGTQTSVISPAGTVQYEFNDTAYVVTSYSITTSADLADMDPKSWTLEGSNDNTSWEAVDTRSDISFLKRSETKYFTINNVNPYKYYRFKMDSRSGNTVKISEIQMFGYKFDQQKVFASGDNAAIGEGMDKAFDGNPQTKWLTFAKTGWITYNFQKPTKVTNYSLTSANDYNVRDPKDWELLASNDNINWVVLDTRSNQTFKSRFVKKLYSIENDTSYVFYKLNILGNNSGEEIQLGEFDLCEVTAGGENQPLEGKEKAFDGLTNTKWLTFNSTDAITIKYLNPFVMSSYALTSANDSPGRNPKDWVLYGSNDNIEWVELDRKSGETFTDYFQRKVYNTANTIPYMYYKLDITKNNGDGIIQLAEIEYLQESSIPPVEEKLQVDFYNGNISSLTNNCSMNYKITNTSTDLVNLSDVTVRYYYTIDSMDSQVLYCDWSSRGTQYVKGNFFAIDNTSGTADYYVEIGFDTAAGVLAPGESVELRTRMAKAYWGDYDQRNDYSFNGISGNYEKWTKTPAYISGNITWGNEP